MSGSTVRPGRLISLWLLAALLAPAGWISIPQASAGQGKAPRPPSLLWKSYPLEQRPSAPQQTQTRPQAREAGQPAATQVKAPQSNAPGSTLLRNVLLVGALLAALVAVASIVLVRSPVTVGFGRLRGPRDPDAPRTQPAAPEPRDDLLDALHPAPPLAPEPARVPEHAVVEEPRGSSTAPNWAAAPAPDSPLERLELGAGAQQERPLQLPLALQLGGLADRMQTAPASEHEQRDREVELRQRPITPGQASERQVERCEIRLWRGYVKCQLYVTVSGSKEAIALSRYFRLRAEEAPGAGAQRARAELLGVLEQDGWTVVSEGALWYKLRLERLVAP